jgi:hypothetical protein
VSALPVACDPDFFEGLDLNQGTIWLDADGVTHRINDMLVTERLGAAAEMERMAAALIGGAEMLQRSRLYNALLTVDEPGQPSAAPLWAARR